MAVSGKLYSNAIIDFMKGNIKWLTTGGSTFKVALMTNSFTPNQTTQTIWSGISANEIAAGNGYTAGGATLATTDPTVSSLETRLDAADVTWSASTITAYYAVIYETGTGRLIGYIDFGGVQSSSAADFKITWHADGIFAIAVA